MIDPVIFAVIVPPVVMLGVVVVVHVRARIQRRAWTNGRALLSDQDYLAMCTPQLPAAMLLGFRRHLARQVRIPPDCLTTVTTIAELRPLTPVAVNVTDAIHSAIDDEDAELAEWMRERRYHNLPGGLPDGLGVDRRMWRSGATVADALDVFERSLGQALVERDRRSPATAD